MCWGIPMDSEMWQINIPDPDDRSKNQLNIGIPNGSVVSSGNFENYTIINGERFSHIVDPRTGIPVRGSKSVTVICPNSEFGDALATAISVLGVDEGLKLVNQLNNIECLIIDEQNQKYFSDGLITKCPHFGQHAAA
jgi:thiamine biosynthesis lipoprotein